MKLIATGLSGTIGRKLNSAIQPAQIVLGSSRLCDYFNPGQEPLTLVHLAGIVGELKVKEDFTYSKKINVDETFLLAREVIEDFRGRFIHISSSHVYGANSSNVTESTPYNPQSYYASQKMLAEQKLIEYFGEGNPQLVILRVFSVLGWDVDEFTLGGLVKRILEGSREEIFNGDDVRDFMTPTSIAEVIATIAESRHISGIFNLCTTNGIKVGDAVRSMFNIMRFEDSYNQIRTGNSQNPYIVGNNRKLLETGIKINLVWNPIDDLQKNSQYLGKGKVN